MTDNDILNEIKDFAVQKLKDTYGFCGILDNQEMIILNSTDHKCREDITIKITTEKEVK